ncbi:hypothetical protein SSX86_001011 [Deinandra increscens subsp. villosa]|uniref:Tr-type G domain-containing protein n=1 Tax=Deinandra increscens subsp. villosa TaxID=3103831 RepID=A0AAP0DU11_9ASTR
MQAEQRQSLGALISGMRYEQGTSGLSSEPIEEDGVEINKKRHLNVVIIGHFEAGKLTIGCQILCLSGQADEQTIKKYVKEAKDKSRESWAHFETESTRFTILHALVHKSYVPNTISGASLADIGVLVISAREGEFETGCESCEETREHVQLAKTWGVSKLLVVVNKMDDPTVNWSKERYDEIESRMVPFLKLSGFGLAGFTVLLSYVHGGVVNVSLKPLMLLKSPPRDPTAPFRMPIIDKSKDMGTVVVMGKVESGSVREGNNMLLMPNKVRVKVVSIYCDEDKVRIARPDENLRVRLSGYEEEEEEDMLSGFVLCSIENPIPTVNEFVAQLLERGPAQGENLDYQNHKTTVLMSTLGYQFTSLQNLRGRDKEIVQNVTCKTIAMVAMTACADIGSEGWHWPVRSH